MYSITRANLVDHCIHVPFPVPPNKLCNIVHEVLQICEFYENRHLKGEASPSIYADWGEWRVILET